MNLLELLHNNTTTATAELEKIIQHSFLAVIKINPIDDQVCYIMNSWYDNKQCKQTSILHFINDLNAFIIHPEDQDIFYQNLSQENLLYHKSLQDEILFQFRCQNSEQSYSWMEAHCFLNDFTQPIFLCTIQDISLEKEKEFRQRRMEYYRLLALKEIFSDIYEIDLGNDIFQSIQETLRDAWSKEKHQMNHQEYIKRHYKFIHEEDVAHWQKHMSVDYLRNEFKKGKKNIHMEYRYKKRNGYHWMISNFLRIDDGGQQDIAVMMTRDISEHMEAKELRTQNEVYKEQVELQIQHYHRLEEMQQELRRFRHDMKNHLLVLESLYKDKKDKEFEAYISDMRGYLKADDTFVETGNMILDALLNEKFAYAQKLNIKIAKSIKIPSNLPIPALDVCVLFGNAFDNAIEACMNMNTEEKKLAFTMVARNSLIVCRLENSASDEQLAQNQTFETTKADKHLHGLGMQNMKNIIKRYDGLFEIAREDHSFVLNITLDLNALR